MQIYTLISIYFETSKLCEGIWLVASFFTLLINEYKCCFGSLLHILYMYTYGYPKVLVKQDIS